MGINKEKEAFEKLPLAELAIKSEYVFYNEETNSYWPNEDFCPSDAPETMNFAWEAWQAAKAQAVPECTWKQNEDGVYDTSCTNYFVFPEPEDRPSDHDFTHCCFCGGQLIEAQQPSSTPDCPDEP